MYVCAFVFVFVCDYECFYSIFAGCVGMVIKAFVIMQSIWMVIVLKANFPFSLLSGRAFGLMVEMKPKRSTSHHGIPRFKSQLCFWWNFPTNMYSGKQQMITRVLGFLPLLAVEWSIPSYLCSVEYIIGWEISLFFLNNWMNE